MATANIAKSAFGGDRPYQVQARRAFPLLVRQAKAGQSIRYGDLAKELGMPNPRNLNYVLGAVGRALEELEVERKIRIPKLTAVVVNKYSGQPSDGILEFLDNPAVFRAASPDVRHRIMEQTRLEIYAFSQWDELLLHWGLKPIRGVGPTPMPVRGSVAEGEAHRQLKEFVAAHPESVGLRRSTRLVGIESLLPSGDEVDVLFATGAGLTAIEIKAHTAPDAEIARGMYQCVKYEAVLRAKQRTDQVPIDARAWLVVGRELPETLIPLKNTLGVHVIEVLRPTDLDLT